MDARPPTLKCPDHLLRQEPPDGRKTPHTEVPRSSPETGPKGFGEVGAPTQKPTNKRVEVQV